MAYARHALASAGAAPIAVTFAFAYGICRLWHTVAALRHVSASGRRRYVFVDDFVRPFTDVGASGKRMCALSKHHVRL